jgi:NADPH2:quinone reductase
MKAVIIEKTGGPDALKYTEVSAPEPKRGEVVVRVAAAGVNYIDTYHRSGLYPVRLPYTLGLEGAGMVERVGDEVSNLDHGGRVAWASGPGSYAELVAVPASQLVRIPNKVDKDVAAAAMLQGMTAHYLMTSTFPVRAGHAVLVHAAAGGVGLLLIQMCKRAGAQVIGTASTPEKAQLAREAGADHIVLYTEEDFQQESRRLTDGRGVNVVFDGVGKSTWEKSLNSLAPRGMLVLFGNASGPVPAIEPLTLSQKGSLFLTRPKLNDYIATREELLRRAGEVLGWIESGELNIRIDRRYPLAEAAQAHLDLESRRTTGKLLLFP